MPDDFNPQKTTDEIERWEDQRKRKTFYPPVGSCCYMLYVNCSAPHQAAIQAQIDAIANQADEVAQLTWHPTAEPDHDPSVDLRVTVRKDDNAPE